MVSGCSNAAKSWVFRSIKLASLEMTSLKRRNEGRSGGYRESEGKMNRIEALFVYSIRSISFSYQKTSINNVPLFPG